MFFLQFGQGTTQRKSKEHFWPALGFWAQNGFQGVAYIGVTTNFFLLVVFLFFLCPLAPNPFCGNLICIVGAEGRGGGNAGGEGGSSKVFCLRFEIHIMFCIALFVFCIWSSWAGHLSIIFYFLSLVFVFLASWAGVQFLVNIYTIYCFYFFHPFCI